MKLLIGTLVVLILVTAPAYGWEAPPLEDDPLYEQTFTQCTFRHAYSSFSDAEIDCLCDSLAMHYVQWRASGEPGHPPPLPTTEEARCIGIQR